METLRISLPDDAAARVRKAADLQGVSAEEWVQRSVEEKLERDRFDAAAGRVLNKNAELYRRLA